MDKKSQTGVIIFIIIILIIASVYIFDWFEIRDKLQDNFQDLNLENREGTYEASLEMTGVNCAQAMAGASYMASRMGVTPEDAIVVMCDEECKKRNETYSFMSHHCSENKFYCDCG